LGTLAIIPRIVVAHAGNAIDIGPKMRASRRIAIAAACAAAAAVAVFAWLMPTNVNRPPLPPANP